MKKIWQTLKLLWFGLFVGLKSTDDTAFHQAGVDLEGGTEINQQVADHSVAKALLRGELTQEVIDLRYRTYAVARESTHYNYFSPTLTKKKGVNDYKFAKDSIMPDEEFELLTIQDNNVEIETVADSLLRIGDDGKFIDKQREYNIVLKRSDDATPRFRLEDFVTKVVVKKGGDEWTAVLDMYVSKYPNDKKPTSKPFIRELERIIEDGHRSDIFDIKTISFDTYKAYHLDDMLHFEFGDIRLERIVEYNGSYVIRVFTNIIDGGSDKTSEYYSERMAKKYENKEKKELTINFDPAANIRTYVCADCGKEVTYDARALDAMNASDDFGDGTITEYLDYEMAEHEFGRMLCKECAAKAQNELYKKLVVKL